MSPSSPSPAHLFPEWNQLLGNTQDAALEQNNEQASGIQAVGKNETTLDRISDNSLRTGTGLPASPPKEVVTRQGEGFAELRQKIISSCNHEGQICTHNRQRIELNTEWEMQQVMSFHPDFGDFVRHLAIIGDEVDAQAVTYEAYVQEHFKAAKEFLSGLQAAWDSGGLYEVSPSEGDLHHLSVMLHGPERERATVAASGSLSYIIDIAQAFAWFFCAMRLAPSEGINLSTFTFDLTTESNPSHSDTVIYLRPSWKRARDIRMGWHDLFTRTVVVYGSPISSHSQFRQSGLPVPKGLYLPFDLMVGLSAIIIPFSHDRGIVMEGLDVIVVATAKWVAESGTAIQWQLVEADHKRSDIFDYVWDPQYYIWDVGEKPILENIGQAHTFLC